jgi:hypothetical protein
VPAELEAGGTVFLCKKDNANSSCFLQSGASYRKFYILGAIYLMVVFSNLLKGLKILVPIF